MYTAQTIPDRTGYIYNFGPFDRLFDGLFTTDTFGRTRDNMDRIYSTEKKNDDGSVAITLSTPGAERENIDVSYHKGILTISYNKPQGSISMVDSFVRRWRVPSELDADNITATYTNGILFLRVPPRSASETTARKIAVN
jgi:HSP20 family protein